MIERIDLEEQKPLKFKALEGVKPQFSEVRKICLADKYERGVGLNGKEHMLFGGICDLGDNAMIECYGRFSLYGNEYYSADELCHMCKDCKYFNGVYLSLTKRYEFSAFYPSGRSAFNPFFIDELLGEYTDYENAKSFVYFIENDKHVKIGHAKNVESRLKDLQVANSVKLRLLYKIPCKSEKASVAAEGKLHNLFRDYHVIGEWYDIAGKINREKWDAVFQAVS